jgi:hypothetical protein
MGKRRAPVRSETTGRPIHSVDRSGSSLTTRSSTPSRIDEVGGASMATVAIARVLHTSSPMRRSSAHQTTSPIAVAAIDLRLIDNEVTAIEGAPTPANRPTSRPRRGGRPAARVSLAGVPVASVTPAASVSLVLVTEPQRCCVKIEQVGSRRMRRINGRRVTAKAAELLPVGLPAVRQHPFQGVDELVGVCSGEHHWWLDFQDVVGGACWDHDDAFILHLLTDPTG